MAGLSSGAGTSAPSSSPSLIGGYVSRPQPQTPDVNEGLGPPVKGNRDDGQFELLQKLPDSLKSVASRIMMSTEYDAAPDGDAGKAGSKMAVLMAGLRDHQAKGASVTRGSVPNSPQGNVSSPSVISTTRAMSAGTVIR